MKSTYSSNFCLFQFKLHRNFNVDFQPCPVGGHNMHGRVERKIREIKSSLEKSTSGERLSILQWETILSRIANSINNLPLALRNKKGDFEVADLVTPNRLRLGRNNDRSPDGKFTVTNDADKMIRANQKIFDSWFECWLSSHVPKLMDHPKWFRSDVDLKEDDFVLFVKQEGAITSQYQYGRVKSVERGRDGKIRKVLVVYRNHNEKTDRETFRAVRSLILIHHVDELDISKELYDFTKLI